jgi:hypothetical protein
MREVGGISVDLVGRRKLACAWIFNWIYPLVFICVLSWISKGEQNCRVAMLGTTGGTEKVKQQCINRFQHLCLGIICLSLVAVAKREESPSLFSRLLF